MFMKDKNNNLKNLSETLAVTNKELEKSSTDVYSNTYILLEY